MQVPFHGTVFVTLLLPAPVALLCAGPDVTAGPEEGSLPLPLASRVFLARKFRHWQGVFEKLHSETDFTLEWD